MKQVLITIATIFSFASCCCDKNNSKKLKYKNIIILSDMSDRILNKEFPIKDSIEIKKILDSFQKESVKVGEKIGDRSSIYFSSFSEKNYISIDLDSIKNLGDKQSFINSTGKYQQNGFNKKLSDFENTIAKKYKTINDVGLDLLSILLEKIQNDNIIKKEKIITNGTDTTIIQYDNEIYILTDGYLEYALKTNNNQFRFGPSKIEALRKYCITNNLNIESALLKNTLLCMLPIKKDIHKIVSINVLETQERDFNKNTQAYDNPIGLRDNEILEAVWRKWAIESQFKNFTWRKY